MPYWKKGLLIVGLLLSTFMSCQEAPGTVEQAQATIGKDSLPEAHDDSPVPDTIDVWSILQDSLQWISRQAWQAKPPSSSMQTHEVSRITLHHSAVPYRLNMDPVKSMQALQRFSQSSGTLGNGKPKKAWADVPYHFVVFPQGQVAEGRQLEYVGDTNTEYDPTGHILINIEGNFEEQEVTEDQLLSVKKICLFLCRKYQIPPEQIATHQDFARTLCPGKHIVELIPEVRGFVEDGLGK